MYTIQAVKGYAAAGIGSNHNYQITRKSNKFKIDYRKLNRCKLLKCPWNQSKKLEKNIQSILTELEKKHTQNV